MSLRPYQEKGVDEIRHHYKSGIQKVLLHLATGGGKTVIFSHIMKATAHNGKRPIMIVRGRHLVDQASKRLTREGAYHGVMMSGHWNYQPLAPIQVCSIDTLNARDLTPPADLIVIDEAHLALSSGFEKFLSKYPNARILAVTATPYVEKSMRSIADVIVHPITVKELIEQGFLVNARYYAPTEPNLDDVKVSRLTGDYVQSELAQVMQQNALTGDLVRHWRDFGENRATIVFATSIEHSKQIVEQFCSAGIRAEHCEAETKDEERQAILERVQSGQTKIVSNVGILCTGVDMPYIGCIVMARPTKSRNLYIQQAGRGTRPFPGKSDFILLDHAGNTLRHGFITEEPEADLDGRVPSYNGPPIRTCSSCYAVFTGFSCACGFRQEISTKDREILEVGGTLEEITELPFDAMILREIEELKKERKRRGFKRGWVYYRIRDKYGEEIAQRFFKRRELPAWLEFSSAHEAG